VAEDIYFRDGKGLPKAGYAAGHGAGALENPRQRRMTGGSLAEGQTYDICSN
jgi:hypothetical protein